jgi:hypothetical protein
LQAQVFVDADHHVKRCGRYLLERSDLELRDLQFGVRVVLSHFSLHSNEVRFNFD